MQRLYLCIVEAMKRQHKTNTMQVFRIIDEQGRRTSYQNFITGVMRTTGLGLEDMQTFEEWIENMQIRFIDQADNAEIQYGFDAWLNKIYNTKH